MTQDYFKSKITFLNVILTIMIVILHAKSPERFGLLLEDYPVIYSISMLCRVATPLFFFLSALLFYKACSFGNLERKFTSRIHSLFVPYVLWNVIYVLLFCFFSHTPSFASKMNVGNILNTPKEIVWAILDSYHSDLWFVRNLMIYTLLSPVLLVVFKNKKNVFLLLFLILSMAIYMQPDYKSLLRWLPVYLMGAVGGYYWDDHILGRIFRNKHDCFFTLGALLSFLIFYGYSLYKNSDIYIIYTSPILIWIVVDGLFYRLIQRMRVKKWMSYMFFIFCTHHFVLNVLQKIVVIYCEPTRFVVYLTYLLSPVICVLLLIKVAGVLSRYRFYKILTGGR